MRYSFSLPAAALALTLAGCAHIPPERGALPERDLASAQHAAGIRLAREGWPEARWWSAYGDSQLDALITQALASGPSLAAARSRIDAAAAAIALERAATGAGIELEGGANRQRYSSNGLFPKPIGGAWFNDVALQVRAGYDFDWWGKHRAQIAAALGEANARRADAALAEQALAASLAQSYFRLQSLWARAANLRQLRAALLAIGADQARRVAHGLAASDGQRNAELELARLDEQAAQLATDAEREREALRALAGAGADALADLQPRTQPPTPQALPATLGMELLARRADLQAAHWRIEAALARIDARKAAFYPDINLAGSVGLDTITLGKLLETSSRTLFVGSALSLPLFDSASLGAQLDGARAQRDAVIADYNQSVINAVREVAQEAVTLRGIDAQLARHAAASAASAALLANARARFEHGLLDRAALLQADLAVQRQEDARLQLLGARLHTEVALTRALGGGYRAAPGAAGPSPTTPSRP